MEVDVTKELTRRTVGDHLCMRTQSSVSWILVNLQKVDLWKD